MKIYIAGKISGEPLAQCTMKFGTIQKCLENLAHEAINPLEVCVGAGLSWHEAMRKDIKALMDCDAIYVLKDYTESRGALLEYQIAVAMDFLIFRSLEEVRKYNKAHSPKKSILSLKK